MSKENLRKTTHVALYIRFANTHPHHDESAQKEYLLGYAKKQGIENIEVYSDHGYSGINLNRPAFQRLLFDIESGKIGKVITSDVSRISRDYIQTHKFIEFLEKNSVSFEIPDGSHKIVKQLNPAVFINRNKLERDR